MKNSHYRSNLPSLESRITFRPGDFDFERGGMREKQRGEKKGNSKEENKNMLNRKTFKG